MSGHFKDGILKACDEVCGKKKKKISKGDTRWWNEEVNEAVSRKMYTRRCVGIVLRRIRGIKSWKIKQIKQFQK